MVYNSDLSAALIQLLVFLERTSQDFSEKYMGDIHRLESDIGIQIGHELGHIADKECEAVKTAIRQKAYMYDQADPKPFIGWCEKAIIDFFDGSYDNGICSKVGERLRHTPDAMRLIAEMERIRQDNDRHTTDDPIAVMRYFREAIAFAFRHLHDGTPERILRYMGMMHGDDLEHNMLKLEATIAHEFGYISRCDWLPPIREQVRKERENEDG